MFEIEGIRVRHRINPRMRHAYLQVEHDGTVVLKSNGKDMQALKRFVLSKRGWIVRQQNRLAQNPVMQSGVDILYLGELLPLERIDSHSFRADSPEALKRSYDRFYKTEAIRCLTEKTHRYAQQMGVSFSAVRFRKMKRRWGSCSKTGVITYNTLLMQLPEACIDYTVVHELAHRVHFNHSADFHALVAAHFPEERRVREQMRRLNAVFY